jgi:ABC-type antimicrobial peptide transport system permease subunit
VFGTASAVARERVKETAVRLALGAPRIAIIRGLIVPFILAAAAGLVAGVLAGLGIAAFGSSLLFGIKPFDLPVLAAVAAVVLCCTTTAAIWPLRHVSRVDVFSVLKEE